jgi:hypothetical protein
VTAADRPLRWAAFASFALPFGLAALCAGNGMGFYDSPELTAAAQGLGATHPPGHPLFVLLGAAAALVPVGAAPLRLALCQAACLGLMGRLALAATTALVWRLGGPAVRPRARAVTALAGALAAVLGPGTLRQATRVEVYALAGLVAAGLLALASCPAGTDGARRARVAALVLGLGAANHHFIALTCAPLALWLIFARLRMPRSPVAQAPARPTTSGWWRAVSAWVGLGLLGLAPYVLLPLRADAPASLPRPRTALELLDVASARVYAKNTGAAVPGSPSGRALDVLDWLGGTLTPMGLLFAAGGLYLLSREARARGDAVRLLVLLAVVAAARAYLGFVRDNPDAAGYLVPAVLALGVALAAFPAGVLRALAEAPPAPRGPLPIARVVLGVLLVGGPLALPVYLGWASVRASAVDRAAAPELLAGNTLGPLRPRTVLFAYDPQTIFRLRYAALVEGERPDVTVVPVPLLGYPGVIPTLLARDGALLPILTRYILRPDLGVDARLLSALAARRAVALEIDPRNIRQAVSVLLPAGLIAQVMPEPTTLVAVRGAAAAHFARMDQLAALLDRDPAARPLVDEALLWHEYTSALFFAARGVRPEAQRAVARALARAPDARELIALRTALAAPGAGPVDLGAAVTEGGQ